MDKVGCELHVDDSAGEDFRVVQLNPPGSACSIALMKNQPTAPGGLHGLHLCVSDIEAARTQLVAGGVEASDFFWFGEAGQQPGLDPAPRRHPTFLSFTDPHAH